MPANPINEPMACKEGTFSILPFVLPALSQAEKGVTIEDLIGSGCVLSQISIGAAVRECSKDFEIELA